MTSYAHRVKPGEKVHLSDYKPDAMHGISRHDGDRHLEDLNTQLTELQEFHYAAGQGGILIVLQAREKDPSKAWKLSTSDWSEHELYGAYIEAYEDALCYQARSVVHRAGQPQVVS